jgi:hypothetical protein
MKGYKASYNGICRDHKFEVGKTYEFDGKPKCCERGFHFCQKPDDVLNYYDIFDNHNRFVLFEVEALGKIATRNDKSCTNKIKIIRIVPKEEYNDVFKNHKFNEKSECIWKKYHTGTINEYKYDDHHIIIASKVTFNSKEVYEYTYDSSENLIWSKSPNNTEYKYDRNTCAIWRKDPDGTEYERKHVNDTWTKIEKK